MAADAILDFVNFEILTVGRPGEGQGVQTASPHQTFMTISQNVAEIWRPSAVLNICDALVWFTHEGHLWSLSLCSIWLESIQ